MKFGYTRVSTGDQNPDLQIDQLRAEGCDEIVSEVASGVKTNRPVLESLLDKARKGDVIIVWKLDRLGRSLKHLVDLTTCYFYKQTLVNENAEFEDWLKRLTTTHKR